MLDIVNNSLVVRKEIKYPDVVTDVSWCPLSDAIFVIGSGDGSLTVFKNAESATTVLTHSKDVSSVDWQDNLLSASWDGTFKMVKIR